MTLEPVTRSRTGAGIEVEGFVIDEQNADKFAAHGLTDRQVVQVLQDEFFVERNKSGERGSHLAIGYDFGGTAITIPSELTIERGLWRPVTAWPSRRAERSRRDRGHR